MKRSPGALAVVFRTLALAVGVWLAPFGVTSVSAHTDFESSTPADGDVVDDPVETVILAFTSEATPVGDEFVALDATGQQRAPKTVATDDGRTFVLTFDPPLAGGKVGVRWKVQAGDAHPIEGAFSFTANIPPPTTPPQTSVVPSTTAAAPATPEIVAPTSAPALVSGVAEEAASPPTERDEAVSLTSSPGTPSTALDEFLEVDAGRSGDTLALTGRAFGFVGVLLALGSLAFLALTFKGTRSEVAFLVSTVRVLGAVIAASAVVEYIGVSMMTDSSLVTAWSTSPGLATTLRLAGGLAIVAGDRFSVQPDPPPRPTRALSAAVLDAPRVARSAAEDRLRWRWQAAGSALSGVVLIVASFWFDGHTVSKGVRPIHAIVNSVHIVAGSVWAGGVAAMAVVVWRRWRRGRPTDASELVVRFSSVASIALVAVVLAGAVMAVFVLDSVGDLTSTEWGRTLMLKTAGVSIAAALGAYNHFRLLPKLRAAPHDERLAAELRSSLTAETIILVLVIVVTAWLVAAAT